jgi:hypothetical protein
MAKENGKQRDKRKLDLQLDRELEGTFPASDPLKITRFSSTILPTEGSSRKKGVRQSNVRKRSF